MTLQIPIDWRTIENALHTWFSSTTGLETIWSNQDAPQPEYPYATLNIVAGPTRVSPHDESRTLSEDLSGVTNVGQEIELGFMSPRMFTVGCQIHVGPPADSDPDCDARAFMSSAEAQLNLPSIQAGFKAANIAFVRTNNVNTLDLVVNGEFISRVTMDVEFATTSLVTERDTYLEGVKSPVSGTFEHFGESIPDDFS